jgi:GntR family transcriptional repressor for pyruvate dehydrogenase complex
VAGQNLETVTRALWELLERQAGPPGSRLPAERVLAAELGVSRPTVREAIGRLAALGAVTARRGSGTYVAQVDLGQVFDVRLQLEPFAAAEAARRHGGREVDQLEATVAAMGAAVDDAERFAARDSRFHAGVARASGNPVLVDVLERLAALAALSRSLTSVDSAVRRHTLDEARAVVAAIRECDAPRAEAAMRAHLRFVRASAPDVSAGPSRRPRRSPRP